MIHVALITDFVGRYATVYGEADSWRDFASQLEDIGACVVENQTEDYDGDLEAIEEDCYHIDSLADNTDFVFYPEDLIDDYYEIGRQSYSVEERNPLLCR